MNYGSYGIGTYAHLSMEDFKQKTATDIVHIPYRGAAPAATALLAGDVSMLLLNLSSIEAHEKTGKVRILAAAGEKRAALRPDLPTVAEAGVPGFSTTAWFALWGPANMAPELVAKIHADVAKALELPQSREFFATNSFERVDLSPAQFARLIQDDSKHWGALIKRSARSLISSRFRRALRSVNDKPSYPPIPRYVTGHDAAMSPRSSCRGRPPTRSIRAPARSRP